MSFESFVTERLADLTSKYNALVVNAKRIFELPVQNNLDPTSLIHVSRDQVSESLSVQKIIDAVNAGDYDHLISIGDITVSGTNVTFPASAEWVISNTYYQNIADITRPVPLAASGLTRIDIAVANTSNDIVIMSGDETDGIAVRPNIPVGTVLVTQINITDSSIVVIPPVLGTEYVKKLESQDVIVNYGATTVIEQINLTDERSSISLIGSVTDVKSVQVSGLYIRMGKPHFFKNRTGHPVKLWHLAGTGNIKYFFPNGLDLIVKPNEVIEFNTNANDSAYVRFERVGGDTAVTGAMVYKSSVANYASLPSSGVEIGWMYNVTDTGHNYVWSGTVWDDLGPAVDISGKEDTSNKSNDIETDKASTSKYGNIAAWIIWLKTYFFPNLTTKATPVLTDNVILGDSADSNKTKKSTLQTIRDLFKAFFDTIYAPKSDAYSKIVYVNATTPTTATIFDLNNPPTTNDNSLKIDVNNLYVGTDASLWVYNSTSSSYVIKDQINAKGFNVWNVKDYGALGNGTTDDTISIQNTINLCFNAGGGIVYFPIGVYIIGGALQTSIGGINYNSQLYIPQTNSNNSARTAISFLGETQPNLVQTLGINTWIAPNSGVVLRSTIQGSGVLPSVICNKGASGNNVTGFSYTNVSFKNLSIQLTPNGSSKLTMGGINCKYSAIANFEYITVFPYNLNLVNSGEPNVIEIVGILMPSINCEHINTVRNCSVGGFTHGYILSEHTSAYDIVAMCCVNSFTQDENHHIGNYGKLSSFWSKYDFNVSGTFSRFVIHALQTEWVVQGKWYDTIATVKDSSNTGVGIINYNIVVGWSGDTGLHNDKYVKIGGDKIKSKQISVLDINKNVSTSTYTFSAGDADCDMIRTSSNSAVTLTVPPYTTYNFDIGAIINVSQFGDGIITFVGGSGVTILSAETLTTRKKYSSVSLLKISANSWILTGDLTLL